MTEEIQLIADAVRDLGELGLVALIIWIIAGVVKAAFAPVAFVAVFWVVGRVIKTVIGYFKGPEGWSYNAEDNKWREVKE